MQSGRLKNKTTRRRFLATTGSVVLAALTALGLGGCGGGGGGGGGGTSGSATISGQVLLVSNNAPPTGTTTHTTVSAGGVTQTASNVDGTFTLSGVPTSATTLTITVAQPGVATLTRTLPVAVTANSTLALGAIYVGGSGYNAAITGRVVTQSTAGTQAVGNATVTIAGVQVKTSASPSTLGQFTIGGLPVGLGSDAGVLLGTVSAAGFETKQLTTDLAGFVFPSGLVTGTNTVGDIVIVQPSGNTPGPPYTIKGLVTVNGAAATGEFIRLEQNGVLVGSTTTDTTGSYSFWVVAGAYTITAQDSSGQFQPRSTTVNLLSLDTPVTAATINLGP